MALLPNRPVTYRHPDGRLEKVFHTVRARELEARGCCCVDNEKPEKPEKPKAKPKPKAAKEEKVEKKVEESKKGKPVSRRRARDEDGKFLGDDPSTPDVNEAWENLLDDPGISEIDD